MACSCIGMTLEVVRNENPSGRALWPEKKLSMDCRKTLKRPSEYQCRHNGTCVVDRHERNSCRYCRFKKCIEVGMDPKGVSVQYVEQQMP
ncbi:zinc finger, C4 type, partial [Ostertagia ostertagi]